MQPPQKLDDPGSCDVLLTVGDVYVSGALWDRSSVNMMSFSTFERIGGLKVKPCKAKIGVADGSLATSDSMVKNILAGICDFHFPMDGVVLQISNFEE